MTPPPFHHPAFQGVFGVASCDITPPVGIHSRNWGAAAHDTAEGIHRPFGLKVLTVQAERDQSPFALISFDLGWWRSKIELAALSEAVVAAGVPAGNFFLSLTHTHSGPIFSPVLSEKPGGDLIAPYLKFLCSRLRESVEEALRNAQAGIWETTSGRCGIASNRDLPDPYADRLLVGWNPEQEADDTLLVGRISDLSGKCLATVVNYACHPTILDGKNRLLSPDFVGAMSEVVEREMQAPCLFLQGASGELAPREQYVGDPAVADRTGRALGHTAVGLFYGMLRPGQELVYSGAVESGAPLAMWTSQPRRHASTGIKAIEARLELALRADLPRADELRSALASCQDRVERERVQRSLNKRELVGDGQSVTQTHHLWRFGDLLIVSVPDEVYSELQLALRREAGALPVFVATLASGSNGYLTPSQTFAAGGYAAVISPYAEGCFEQTVSFLQAELKKLL